MYILFLFYCSSIHNVLFSPVGCPASPMSSQNLAQALTSHNCTIINDKVTVNFKAQPVCQPQQKLLLCWFHYLLKSTIISLWCNAIRCLLSQDYDLLTRSITSTTIWCCDCQCHCVSVWWSRFAHWHCHWFMNVINRLMNDSTHWNIAQHDGLSTW